MPNEETMYPLDVVLQGTPISLQSKSGKNREAWKQRVTEASRERREATYELGFLDDRSLAISIYYFPSAPMEGDIDNIVKPILDAMIGVAFPDDNVVEHVTVQKIEPECDCEFLCPSDQLLVALDLERPVVYIHVRDDLSWRKIK